MTTYSQPVFKPQYASRRNVWIVVEYCDILGSRTQAAVRTFTTESAASKWLAANQ